MKKLLLTLLLLFSVGMVAKAEVANVTVETKQSNISTSTNTQIVNDGDFTITYPSGTNFSTDHIRLYAGKTMTIEAIDGITIQKIEFTTTGSYTFNMSSDPGTIDNANKNWTGSASSISITNKSNAQIRFTKLVITYEKEAQDPEAVSISAKSGETKYLSGEIYEVEAGTEVTFSVTNYNDATITAIVGSDIVDFVDGSYTATINEDTEVLITVDKNGKTVEASYNFVLKQVPAMDGTGWVLVTDAAQLNAGDLLIIASGSAAAGNKSNTNNRPSVNVTITENVLTYSETAENQPLIVKLGGSTGKWTFETTNYLGTDGYLASATSGSNNHLKVQSTAMTATIAIGSNNNATVVFDAGGSFNRTTLMKNSNSALFACYSGGQDPIQLYKYVAPDPTLEGEPTINVTHASKKGVLIVEYSFNIANHNGNPVEVTANVAGMEQIKFTDATPANAPARVAGESTAVIGTLRAEHADLVDASNINVNLTATIGGKEFFTRQATVTNTTGIEDVTVEGEGEAEYFNLQGLRVAQPEAGQLYIKRQAGKAVKVRF